MLPLILILLLSYTFCCGTRISHICAHFGGRRVYLGVCVCVPGTPEAVVPDRVFRATSTCFLWKPISMSWRTMGSGGTGEAFCFFCRGGRTCCTVTGVVASLELLSSNRGEDGLVDSTARYWHTASAAAW